MTNQTIYFQARPVLFSVLFTLNGLFQFGISVYRFITDGYSHLNLGFALVGFTLLFFGLTMHPRLPFIPKVNVNDDEIKLKPGYWTNTTTLAWSRIKEIIFDSYRVEFAMKNGTVYPLDIPQVADISLDVKKALREKSEEKQIEITSA